MLREPLSNVNVLIVGAGLGGLYTAIESYRQGHSPTVLEGKSEPETLGDFVGIGPSATRQFEKWPGMSQIYSSIIYRPDLNLLSHDGKFLGGPFRLSEESHYRPVPVSRPKLIKALYEYAISLGIPVLFSKRVVEYGESDIDNHAFVVTDKDERFEADVVVAADGIGSKVDKIMSGRENKAMSSGVSAYRVTYPTALLLEDPFLAEKYPLKHGDPDYCEVYLSAQGQAIVLVGHELTTWLLTHVDKGKAGESWSSRLSAADALHTLEETGLEWDERVRKIIKVTPPNTVVDFKITWRDPDTTWTSKGGRVVKIGDAAHAFIPNSTNGATQAMEDGISLAACLKLAGKHGIPFATRVHTKLRFERTACAQKTGFTNREKWNVEDFEAVKEDPMKYVASVGNWISNHNPEQYTYDNWHACLDHISNGADFRNTNIPPGYTYKHWTMKDLFVSTEQGELAVDAGDWS